jgi:hypothetical protein
MHMPLTLFMIQVEVILRIIITNLSIQHYGIKFVSDLPQVGGFLRVLRFPPPIKLTAMI